MHEPVLSKWGGLSLEPAQRFEALVAETFPLGGRSGWRDGIDVEVMLFQALFQP
jgi:hypothetical protein